MRVINETYFSNLGLENTLKYSDAISDDTNKAPFCLARFKANPGIECSFINALSNVLVSNTQNSSFIF